MSRVASGPQILASFWHSTFGRLHATEILFGKETKDNKVQIEIQILKDGYQVEQFQEKHDFQIKDMNHAVHQYTLLILELVSFVKMATTTVEEDQPSAPMIIVAGLAFLMLQTNFQLFNFLMVERVSIWSFHFNCIAHSLLSKH